MEHLHNLGTNDVAGTEMLRTVSVHSANFEFIKVLSVDKIHGCSKSVGWRDYSIPYLCCCFIHIQRLYKDRDQERLLIL